MTKQVVMSRGSVLITDNHMYSVYICSIVFLIPCRSVYYYYYDAE